ncbi:MAG: nucleotidyltransferase family protein [Ignavibacteriae bacterium]|nr:hypothetical protein [Ignavibacteriota bacterium]NOG99077.1 nucleotidyltransferase family protein [Ignavibacteriota bacterium]
MKKDIDQILKTLQNLIPTLKEKYEISSIEVFRSYVNNLQKKNSDLDLLVTFKRTPGLLKYIKLENFLSDSLGIKVDLVMKNSIKPRFRESILSNTIPV